MPRVRVNSFAISIDGFGAGPGQSLENPLGLGGGQLHDWFYPTRTFQTMVGKDEGSTGPDEDFAARGMSGIGAWILGRNMFAPFRGPWPDETWKGWWGDNPPYHVPTFILTHHARDPIEMAGGTTFHFITGGMLEALVKAKEAAGGKDVRIGGGTATIRQYLQAGLIDEMHLVVSPVLLGSGEHLLKNIDLVELGYQVTEHVATEKATHVVVSKKLAG
jgi:dihydrofolate reductase